MSILWSFRKYIDPEQQALEDTDRRIERQRPRRAGDRDGPPQDDGAAAPPPAYACRVCGHRDAERAYCPTCLADTMEPLGKPSTRRPR